jgi:hypothetical protein
MAGTYWIADAPVPTDATRLPARSTSWSQRAECIVMPLKSSRPSIAGTFGSVSGPVAQITTRAWMRPSVVSSSQRPASSFQVALSTLQFVRTNGRTPNSSAVR